MPQFYKKKTDREVISENVMRKAVKEVVEEKKAVRCVAKSYGIPRSTLKRLEIETLMLLLSSSS